MKNRTREKAFLIVLPNRTHGTRALIPMRIDEILKKNKDIWRIKYMYYKQNSQQTFKSTYRNDNLNGKLTNCRDQVQKSDRDDN